jgi:hypothetical protein
MLRRLFRHTVWAEDAIPPDDAYRSYRRFWLPLVDLIYIAGGISLLASPVNPALSEVWRGVTVWYGLALALVALVTLIGAAFPRLWAVEVFGKAGILFLIAFLAAACMLTGRPFGAFLAAAAAVPVLFRLSVLGAERAVRRRKKEQEQNPGGP